MIPAQETFLPVNYYIIATILTVRRTNVFVISFDFGCSSRMILDIVISLVFVTIFTLCVSKTKLVYPLFLEASSSRTRCNIYSSIAKYIYGRDTAYETWIFNIHRGPFQGLLRWRDYRKISASSGGTGWQRVRDQSCSRDALLPWLTLSIFSLSVHLRAISMDTQCFPRVRPVYAKATKTNRRNRFPSIDIQDSRKTFVVARD